MENTSSTNPKKGSARPTTAYHANLWGDYFITGPPPSSTCKESESWMKQRRQTLIDNVKVMLSGNEASLAGMHLIDALQRLGVDYHFEKEIGEALRGMHDGSSDQTDYDLHGAALQFRLLRQHRYDIPSGIFEAFRDGKGNFKSSIASDVRGLLSLYEAAYLGKPGEDVLDQAISFTVGHLHSMATNIDQPLQKQVLLAIETPLRRKMQRLEARHYISIYEQDSGVRNNDVLELAKLDFHLLQQLHRQELKDICLWWKKWDLQTKLPFARDRIVECYFWILGVFYEPNYSRARMMTTKVIYVLSLMDDLYDNYGTMDELQLYTDAIQRWSLEGAKPLEECCGVHFLALTSIMRELEEELAKDGLSDHVYYLKETIKEASRAWLEETKWREGGYVPSFKNHLQVSMLTSCYGPMACASFIGMGDVVPKEALEWVISFPNIIKAITIIARLMDDVVSYELETKRDHVSSTIHCYVQDYGSSFQEACDKLLEMVEDSWRDINKEILELTYVPTPLIMRILNLSRMMETIYRKGDGYTHSKLLKKYIQFLLIEPIEFK